VNGEDAFVTILEGLGQLLETAAVVGPWVLLVFGLLFLVVFGLALTFIISVWRDLHGDSSRLNRRQARVLGRVYRG